ncbi:AAA family ATPase (plasmid) [Alkalibacillus sp. S2W]|uniref:AAA family ATPase n=1 Tax=Alkalibacillus sp. S2W TaxID=3386553 RepID=UPI00398CFA84
MGWQVFFFDCSVVYFLVANFCTFILHYTVEQVLYSACENNNSIHFITEVTLKNFVLDEFGSFFNEIEEMNIKEKHTDVKDEDIAEQNQQSKNKVIEIKPSKLDNLFNQVNASLVGHNNFKKILMEEINMFRFFNKEVNDLPIMSIFLLGPSGVGKTEIARIMHNFLDENSRSPLAKINFANYKSESSLASLIGSPPGYKDSDGESDLVQKLRKSNTGILLVDEFEKADSAAHNFFLQLLEEGTFDDAMGKIYNLDGYIIIFTSNLDSEGYKEEIPPELRSRFNMVTRFNHLNSDEKITFASMILNKYSEKSDRKMSSNDKNMILENIDLINENNLRNIQKKVRRNFYYYIKEIKDFN